MGWSSVALTCKSKANGDDFFKNHIQENILHIIFTFSVVEYKHGPHMYCICSIWRELFSIIIFICVKSILWTFLFMYDVSCKILKWTETYCIRIKCFETEGKGVSAWERTVKTGGRVTTSTWRLLPTEEWKTPRNWKCLYHEPGSASVFLSRKLQAKKELQPGTKDDILV